MYSNSIQTDSFKPLFLLIMILCLQLIMTLRIRILHLANKGKTILQFRLMKRIFSTCLNVYIFKGYFQSDKRASLEWGFGFY